MYMMVSGKMIHDLVKDKKFGKMGMFIMEIGKMIKEVVRDFLYGIIITCIKVSGKIIKKTDLVQDINQVLKISLKITLFIKLIKVKFLKLKHLKPST